MQIRNLVSLMALALLAASCNDQEGKPITLGQLEVCAKVVNLPVDAGNQKINLDLKIRGTDGKASDLRYVARVTLDSNGSGCGGHIEASGFDAPLENIMWVSTITMDPDGLPGKIKTYSKDKKQVTLFFDGDDAYPTPGQFKETPGGSSNDPESIATRVNNLKRNPGVGKDNILEIQARDSKRTRAI